MTAILLQAPIKEGLIISVVGYVIVFIALFILYMAYYYFPILMKMHIKLKLRGQGKKISDKEMEEDISGDVNAAISVALYLHFNQYHDEENTVMTIKRISKMYSPWSSKIWGVSNNFNTGARNVLK